MKKIMLITTGGTIEKTYNEKDGSLSNQGSLLKAMLAKLRLPNLGVEQTNLIAKDSLNINEEDRRLVLQEVKKHLPRVSAIVVLHGTDTMEHTARLIYDQVPDPPVPVIFTGAMKPFGFEDSDALQNLTEALLAAGMVGPGVYIVFHNKILPLPGVRKNMKLLTFEKHPED
jgi:L-asparaginase